MTGKKPDVFCKIVSGDIASAKIWEDKDFMAILDVNPNTRGMTLVIPKKHYDSYYFDMDDRMYAKLMLAVKKVAKILEKGLKVKRVAMVMEGTSVNHVHIKLYPLHGVGRKFKEIKNNERKYYDRYEGIITTHLGPQVSDRELERLAVQIRRSSKE